MGKCTFVSCNAPALYACQKDPCVPRLCTVLRALSRYLYLYTTISSIINNTVTAQLLLSLIKLRNVCPIAIAGNLLMQMYLLFIFNGYFSGYYLCLHFNVSVVNLKRQCLEFFLTLFRPLTWPHVNRLKRFSKYFQFHEDICGNYVSAYSLTTRTRCH